MGVIKYTWKFKGEESENTLFLKTYEESQLFDFVISLPIEDCRLKCDKQMFNKLKYLYSEAFGELDCENGEDYVEFMWQRLLLWGYELDNAKELEYMKRDYTEARKLSIHELESTLGYSVDIISDDKWIYDALDYDEI